MGPKLVSTDGKKVFIVQLHGAVKGFLFVCVEQGLSLCCSLQVTQLLKFIRNQVSLVLAVVDLKVIY